MDCSVGFIVRRMTLTEKRAFSSQPNIREKDQQEKAIAILGKILSTEHTQVG